MIKKCILLFAAAVLLVSCGKSPEDILDKELTSLENVATALDSNDSARDKEDVIRKETERMKDLYDDARGMKGYDRKDFIKAHVNALQNDDKLYALALLAAAADSSTEDKDVAKALNEYMMQLLKVESEMGKSCGFDNADRLMRKFL